MKIFVHPVPPEAKRKIYSLSDEDGTDRLSAFFQEQSAKNSIMENKVLALIARLKRLACDLLRHDMEVLREIKLGKSDRGPKIYEVKRKPLRILFFYQPDGIIVCTNGCYKDGQKTPPECIAKAVSGRNAYLEAVAAQSVEYVNVEVEHYE